MDSSATLTRRKLPKLMACITKNSLENFRNRALFSMDVLDAKGIRRRRKPLYQCLILELRESGFNESSDYLQDLIYDNIQLVNEDDIGIVVDLRKKDDYLEHIVDGLQKAEKQRDKGNTKQEALELLELALHYAEKGKGILWLSEKFFLAAIAVSSRYLIDGGRQKAICRYYYGKFLLDKFPGADPEEPFNILTEVRDLAIGKTWPLFEANPDDPESKPSKETVFASIAVELHRVLLSKARLVRKEDPGKSERLSRLAERRAKEAGDLSKTAEAIIEIGICQLIMNNLNNAQKTFERAFKIFSQENNTEGLCAVRMHLSAVMQRLGDHETAARLLTEMGALAMQHGLRRQLGRALHLLGELHLRRERPELGTKHLAEAFACFMGYVFEKASPIIFTVESKGSKLKKDKDSKGVKDKGEIELIHSKTREEVYEEEAEQSRLMMAISAGQELMASYFSILREAHGCNVAQSKTIEWKLNRSGWWVSRRHHELVPCMCKIHNRTPLDVLRRQLELKELDSDASEQSQGALGPSGTASNIMRFRSSYQAQSKLSNMSREIS